MAKEKGVQVSATISPELNQALEDHRWSVRLTKTELVRVAVEEYAHKHHLTLPAEADAEPDAV
jgi:hypothetical protein